jgi:hypothetical protein
VSSMWMVSVVLVIGLEGMSGVYAEDSAVDMVEGLAMDGAL